MNLLERIDYFYITMIWTSMELGYLDQKEKPVDWPEVSREFKEDYKKIMKEKLT